MLIIRRIFYEKPLHKEKTVRLSNQTDQQLIEGELRVAINDIRNGNALAFAVFTSRLFMLRIEPERIRHIKESHHVTDNEYTAWEKAYYALPEAQRNEAEHLIDYFTGGLNEYLTFRIGANEFGIDILRVQEIRSFEMPTGPGQQEGAGASLISSVPSCCEEK